MPLHHDSASVPVARIVAIVTTGLVLCFNGRGTARGFRLLHLVGQHVVLELFAVKYPGRYQSVLLFRCPPQFPPMLPSNCKTSITMKVI